MIQFARNTPSEVAKWLGAALAAIPDHPILLALATDERISALWGELEEWQPGALAMVQLAFHFSSQTILSNLQKPPEERIGFSWPEYPLGLAAEDLADRLEWWADAGAELLGEPVAPFDCGLGGAFRKKISRSTPVSTAPISAAWIAASKTRQSVFSKSLL